MQDDIFKKIENAKPLDFGEVLSQSFDLYKKSFSQGLIHTLIAIIIGIPFLLIIYIPVLPMYVEILQNAGDPYYEPSALNTYSPVMIIGWVILVFLLSLIMQVVNYSIYGHFFKQLKNIDYGTQEDEGGYFTLLQKHFGKILLLTLAMTGIAVAGALLCYLPLFYLMVPLHWFFPIFVFNEELSVSEVIKAAFKLGNKYWLVFFGLGIVVSIIASIGMIVCYIGLIATLFFTYIATYVAYKHTIGFGDHGDAISQIGKPLPETS